MIDITPIMQAAERLIRVQGGETEVAVYWPLVKERTGSQYLNRRLVDAARRDDERLVLSDILPKGKRPVAIEQPRACNYPVEPHSASAVCNGVAFPVWCCCQVCRSREGVVRHTDYYRTEAEAHLAVQWAKFDELIAAAR